MTYSDSSNQFDPIETAAAKTGEVPLSSNCKILNEASVVILLEHGVMNKDINFIDAQAGERLHDAEAEIKRLNAEVARLQEALKPFADMFAEYQAFNGSKFSSITDFISSEYESGDMWRLLNNIKRIATASEPDHR